MVVPFHQTLYKVPQSSITPTIGPDVVKKTRNSIKRNRLLHACCSNPHEAHSPITMTTGHSLPYSDCETTAGTYCAVQASRAVQRRQIVQQNVNFVKFNKVPCPLQSSLKFRNIFSIVKFVRNNYDVNDDGDDDDDDCVLKNVGHCKILSFACALNKSVLL